MLQEILTENIAYWLFLCNFSQTNSFMKCIIYIKICFKMKEILHFKVPSNIQHIWLCFVNIIRTIKNNFFPLYSLISFCCHYRTLKNKLLWLAHKSSLHRPCKTLPTILWKLQFCSVSSNYCEVITITVSNNYYYIFWVNFMSQVA